MQKEPPPFVWAAPDEKDILTCAPSFSHVMELALIPIFSREFYHCRTAFSGTNVVTRLTHHPSLSTDHQIPPT